MKQQTTLGIILNRTDYGEADRILTLLTPEFGKLRLLAKGVRRVKSKMAGGIELFSISQIGFIKGRSDIGTLTSTRLSKHYGKIVTDLDRTMAGYDIIKRIDKVTEEGVEREFFDVLQQTFEALDDMATPLSIVQLWFEMHLLELNGRSPNLETDEYGEKLLSSEHYSFNTENMSFQGTNDGRYTSDHIKMLRLARDYSPRVLAHVMNSQDIVKDLLRLLEAV